MSIRNPEKLSKLLHIWFQENQRPLPWRRNQDPYSIWLSEVMLQQTTVQAVIPYFEKFLSRFPTLRSLAKAPESDVLENWAGLGYYSRARNLHAAAKALDARGFPKTHTDLLELPGFGPYTARAVASLAFGEKVGVLDGNVIRVLCRMTGLQEPWWNSKTQKHLQHQADLLCQNKEPSASINQGLMELGRTICTPKNPTCLLCPWRKDCLAFAEGKTGQIPLARPRKESEAWSWEPELILEKGKVALIRNTTAPFLKNQLIFPGPAKKIAKRPSQFTFEHGITHHQIFVSVKKTKSQSKSKQKDLQWVNVSELKKINPSSLLQKVLQAKGLKVALPLLIFVTLSFLNLGPNPGAWAQTPTPDLSSKLPLTGQITLMDLSEDGDQLLFTSKNRASHKLNQLYALNLPELKEKRITFSDGQVVSALWIDNKTVVYSSSTDKLKESSPFKEHKDLKLSELYESDLDGENIRRLTHSEALYEELSHTEPGARRGSFLVRRLSQSFRQWLKWDGSSLTPVKTPAPLVVDEAEQLQLAGLLATDHSFFLWDLSKKEKTKVYKLSFESHDILHAWSRSPESWTFVGKRKNLHRYEVLQLDLSPVPASATGIVAHAQILYSTLLPIRAAFANPHNHRLIYELQEEGSTSIFVKNWSAEDASLPVSLDPVK
jgi:A/G-specific adenine glycosylase